MTIKAECIKSHIFVQKCIRKPAAKTKSVYKCVVIEVIYIYSDINPTPSSPSLKNAFLSFLPWPMKMLARRVKICNKMLFFSPVIYTVIHVWAWNGTTVHPINRALEEWWGANNRLDHWTNWWKETVRKNNPEQWTPKEAKYIKATYKTPPWFDKFPPNQQHQKALFLKKRNCLKLKVIYGEFEVTWRYKCSAAFRSLSLGDIAGSCHAWRWKKQKLTLKMVYISKMGQKWPTAVFYITGPFIHISCNLSSRP